MKNLNTNNNDIDRILREFKRYHPEVNHSDSEILKMIDRIIDESKHYTEESIIQSIYLKIIEKRENALFLIKEKVRRHPVSYSVVAVSCLLIASYILFIPIKNPDKVELDTTSKSKSQLKEYKSLETKTESEVSLSNNPKQSNYGYIDLAINSRGGVETTDSELFEISQEVIKRNLRELKIQYTENQKIQSIITEWFSSDSKSIQLEFKSDKDNIRIVVMKSEAIEKNTNNKKINDRELFDSIKNELINKLKLLR